MTHAHQIVRSIELQTYLYSYVVRTHRFAFSTPRSQAAGCRGLGGLGWQVVEVGVKDGSAGPEARYRSLSTAWFPERARSV